MWLHPLSVKKNAQTYISPKRCSTPEIKSKYFRTSECVGIGQTTVPVGEVIFQFFLTKLCPFFDSEFSKCSDSRALAPACGALGFFLFFCFFVDMICATKVPEAYLGHPLCSLLPGMQLR